MKAWLGGLLKLFVAGLVLFGSLFALGLPVFVVDRYGFDGAAILTGILTWAGLALIGLSKIYDAWFDRVLADMGLRKEFATWYMTRLRARKGGKERFPA